MLENNNSPIVSLNVDPSSVVEGVQATLDFSLSQAAPEGGLVLSLTSTDTDPAFGDIIYNVGKSSNIAAFKDLFAEGANSGTTFVTIAEGATTAQLVVDTVADGIAEGNETLGYTLFPTKGYTVDPTQNGGSFTITDAPIVSLNIEPTSVVEGVQATLNFSLSQAAPKGGLVLSLTSTDTDPAFGDIIYNVGKSSNIAAFKDLFAEGANSGTTFVTIAEGAITAQLVVDTVADGIAEGNETLGYTLFPTKGYTIDPTQNGGSFTITDAPIVSVSAEPNLVEEGNQLKWNFNLSQPAPEAGLKLEFALTQDTDPLPGDIQYNVAGSSNIEGFELLRDATGTITGATVNIAPGATAATLVNNPHSALHFVAYEVVQKG